MKYTDVNSKIIDKWNEDGWIWARPVSPEQIAQAKKGEIKVVLTPIKEVPRDWFPADMKGVKILGLASGGGQQMPLFAAMGADCTTFDYSQKQLDNDIMVAKRENLNLKTVRGDMTKPLPFADEEFDLIFHPVSNCYIQDVVSVWKECYRVLKKGGVLLAGLDMGLAYAFDDNGVLERKLPFNPLEDENLYKESLEKDWGIQFSHTIEEQIGGQLKAGFTLVDIYGDTDGEGKMREYNIMTFCSTKAKK
ncbi:MAG TPA: class I SAM-dependent methyltransferase [Clostridia bacterium]|nr:class I SAM-dependent methyltransferase [Clostridia bacterium]